jgi:flagellin-specific chaperone FliS
MLPQQAYQQRATGMTRIDTILGLYDQALAKINQAEDALARHDQPLAAKLMNHAQLAVSGLVCAVEGHADEQSLNFLRLYEFVVHHLSQATPESARAAKQVLQTLREAFEAIRPEALRLEREGAIPSLDRPNTIQVTA